MKIVVFCAYYEPEVAASLYLAVEVYEGLAQKGIEVELYTPVPTRGVSEETRDYYKEHLYEEKYNGNLRIHRMLLKREKAGTLSRALRYIYMNFKYLKCSLNVNADCIYVQSTPPTQGAMAAIIKKIKKVPFVYNLQDVFPDSMVGAGMIQKKSFIWKIGRCIENFTYRNAEQIIVISEAMKKNILSKGVPEDKISVVYNWVDSENVVPIEKEKNILYEELGLEPEKFYVVYAGNLGYPQNIKLLLEAAKMLEEISQLEILVFGAGAQEQECKEYAKNLRLSNTRFFSLQPYDKVSYVYSLADLSIVICKKGLGGSAMPSKMWSIMSSGTAVLASFDKDTDVEKILEENDCGYFVQADDADALANKIMQAYENQETCKIKGENGRKAILEKYDRSKGIDSYIRIISEVCN